MDEYNIDNDLIEYILTLLNIPEKIENSNETGSDCLLDSQYIRTAQGALDFMDEMPGGFLIYHADGNEQIVYANKALREIFGCENLTEFQELTGNSFKGVVHPDDLEEVERGIEEQIFVNKYDLDYVEYRIIRKDGSIRRIENYGRFVKNKIIGNIFYAFLGDATEKINRRTDEMTALINENKEKEQKIKIITEKYNDEREKIDQEHLRHFVVIEGLSINYESILYVDLETNQVFPYRLSSRTKLQFDNEFKEIDYQFYLSNYIGTWVYSEDRELVAEKTSVDYMRKQLSENQTYYINYRVCQSEKIKYLQLRIVNVGNEKNISKIVMGYKNIDEEILKEIQQKKTLEDALNNAKISNIAKDVFLANMSHDMRTPLNAIFGFTELAKNNIEDMENVKKYLQKINTSSRQLLELIDNVLEISKTEAREIIITECSFNLCDTIREVYDYFRIAADEKNINFSLNTDSINHCNIFADKDKVKQFLTHLTSNAIKYTNPGESVEIIAAEIRELSDDYSIYKFIVKDSGIGMSQDFLQRVFDPFEREKNTTFSGVLGIGLGLTITKNIIEMMGGNIKAESVYGEGSTFTVEIGFKVQEKRNNYSFDIEHIIDNMSNNRILLVDDNEINLEIETEILKELGFDIETAENGKIAVEKIKGSSADKYALILMDIQMPVMNGHEAARAIRNLDDPVLANIPIIALSANAFESDKRMSLESGMNEHLTKPINVPLLMETIVKTITHKDNT